MHCMVERPDEFNAAARKLKDINLVVFYKLQYLPMDRFIWGVVPGFPKGADTLSCSEVITEIENFKNSWSSLKTSLLYEMETGRKRHPAGRLFNPTELDFARKKNPKPNFAIRFGAPYPADTIARKKRSVVGFMAKEIKALKRLVSVVVE